MWCLGRGKEDFQDRNRSILLSWRNFIWRNKVLMVAKKGLRTQMVGWNSSVFQSSSRFLNLPWCQIAWKWRKQNSWKQTTYLELGGQINSIKQFVSILQSAEPSTDNEIPSGKGCQTSNKKYDTVKTLKDIPKVWHSVVFPNWFLLLKQLSKAPWLQKSCQCNPLSNQTWVLRLVVSGDEQQWSILWPGLPFMGLDTFLTPLKWGKIVALSMCYLGDHHYHQA